MRYIYAFTSTFPEKHPQAGGTFCEGEFELEPEELAENLPTLLRDMVESVPEETLRDQTIKLEVKPCFEAQSNTVFDGIPRKEN